jgi:glucose-6-phosphate dehydrogenase assembly protein OpcA
VEAAVSATVSAERILHDLANLWVDLARQGGEQGSGVLRACTMTLIVLCGETDDAQAIGEIIARIMPQHPSRAIVVRVTASPDKAVDAHVFAQCWKPFGEGRHICAEEIEIVSTPEALPDVAPLLLPLPAADLPVVLWCRDVRLLDAPGFFGIAAMANRIVLDGAPVARVQNILGQGQAVGDLAWTRLTRWRELIARIYANRGLESLQQVSTVTLHWPAPSGYYMAAWLEDCLRRAGADPKIKLDTAAANDRSVELVAPGQHVMVSHCPPHCAEIHINETAYSTMLPEVSDDSLMREELAIAGHDPVFERVLPVAARFALSS